MQTMGIKLVFSGLKVSTIYLYDHVVKKLLSGFYCVGIIGCEEHLFALFNKGQNILRSFEFSLIDDFFSFFLLNLKPKINPS